MAKRENGCGVRRLGCGLAVGFALLAGALAKGALPAGGFEAPRVVSAEEVLTLSARVGPGYEIADAVEADGFSQHFTLVTRDFGDIPATSDFMVAIRIEEMNALIALEKISRSRAYGKAVAKSGAVPARLLKNLITQPVDTLTGVPKGIAKAGKKVYQWFSGDRRQRSEMENSAAREAFGFSGRKRGLARELGVDPFSSNAELQDRLNSISWASFSGGMSVSVALAAVGVPTAMGHTYRVSSVMTRTGDLVTSVSGGDLHRRNRGVLVAMGIDAEVVEIFLNNPHMSPTHKTAITLALEGMDGVAGRDHVIALGVAVDDEDAAVRLQRTVELARGYHANVSPGRELVLVGDDLLLHNESAKLIATLPADRLLWTEATRDLAAAMTAHVPEGHRVDGREVWITGVFSKAARSALEGAGFRVHEKAQGALEPELPPENTDRGDAG